MNLDRYQKVVFWPLTVLSVAFLFVFCASNFHLAISEQNSQAFRLIDKFIWAIFVLDYLIMFVLAEKKSNFLKTHIPHLIVVVVPFLRVLRVARLILMLTNLLGMMKNRILVSIPIYVLSSSALFILIGAAAIYDAEYQDPGSGIKTRGDAFWWAGALIFSYFYNETPPVTEAGRLYGFLLTLCGLSIVGTITATFAGWLISQVKEIESDSNKILEKLEQIDKKLS
jgi:voltage-gated potassium channel